MGLVWPVGQLSPHCQRLFKLRQRCLEITVALLAIEALPFPEKSLSRHSGAVLVTHDAKPAGPELEDALHRTVIDRQYPDAGRPWRDQYALCGNPALPEVNLDQHASVRIDHRNDTGHALSLDNL
jgi:hypothetical protein